MTARRGPAAYLRLRVGSRHEVAFVPFPARAPMFVIGAAGTVVSFTLPEQIEAGHVTSPASSRPKRGPTRWRSNAGTGACPRCRRCRSRTR